MVDGEMEIEIDRSNITIAEYRAKEEDGLGNVVKFVQWGYNWTHPDYPGAIVSSGFMTELPEADSENFINFEDITEEILKEWVIEADAAILRNVYENAMERMPFEYRLSQTVAYTIV